MSDYDFTNIVREVVSKENIQECKIEYTYSTNKGDGYTGTIKAVKLVGSNKTIDVVFKYSHRNPETYKKFPLRDMYLHEIRFYEVIVPSFAKFQEEHNIEDPFNNTAKFYASVKEPFNELLVLENLTSQNYDLWNRKQLMNKEHLEYVMKTFGTFHGTCFAMKEINPEAYNNLCRDLKSCDLFATTLEMMDYCKQNRQAIKDVSNIFDPVMEKVYWDKLNQFADNIETEFDKAINYHQDDIILQGDCWCNNMMFQYEDMNDRTKPKNLKLLDFQLVKLGSPAWDLSYFFYTAAPKESFDVVDYFLKLYHNSMGEHLKKFNLNVEDIFPYSKLEKHWENVCRFGFFMSFLLRKMMLMESEDAAQLAENSEEFISNTQIDSIKQVIYEQQIKELAMHFVDRKFI